MSLRRCCARRWICRGESQRSSRAERGADLGPVRLWPVGQQAAHVLGRRVAVPFDGPFETGIALQAELGQAQGAVGFFDEGKLLQPPDMLLRQMVSPAEAQRHAAKRDLFVWAERCEDPTHACPAAVRGRPCGIARSADHERFRPSHVPWPCSSIQFRACRGLSNTLIGRLADASAPSRRAKIMVCSAVATSARAPIMPCSW